MGLWFIDIKLVGLMKKNLDTENVHYLKNSRSLKRDVIGKVDDPLEELLSEFDSVDFSETKVEPDEKMDISFKKISQSSEAITRISQKIEFLKKLRKQSHYYIEELDFHLDD